MATGRSTLLQSLKDMSMKGSSIVAPKNLKRSAGVRNIPAMLLMIALHNADAVFPPEAVVKITHMLTVVGRQVSISNPSNKASGKRPVRKTLEKRNFMGRPMRYGHAAKVPSCINELSLKFDAAALSCDNSSARPDNRNIKVTPYLPINNSGRRTPPLDPREGHILASATATNIPTRKKFLFAKSFALSNIAPNPSLERGDGLDAFFSAVRRCPLSAEMGANICSSTPPPRGCLVSPVTIPTENVDTG
mmetsp:Transcript_13144/g.17199  ORF Transcript_13144/g.17199 Transcript_13144/m.17199 type:complete len:248 (+) Transcript_13144:1792-2535(+)